VNAVPASAVPLGFVRIIVNVDVPFTNIGFGLKALVTVKFARTASVAVFEVPFG